MALLTTARKFAGMNPSMQRLVYLLFDEVISR